MAMDVLLAQSLKFHNPQPTTKQMLPVKKIAQMLRNP